MCPNDLIRNLVGRPMISATDVNCFLHYRVKRVRSLLLFYLTQYEVSFMLLDTVCYKF